MTWKADHFTRSLRIRGLTLFELHRQLRVELGEVDVPARSTVYEWAKEGSKGPRYSAWRRAVASILRRSRAKRAS